MPLNCSALFIGALLSNWLLGGIDLPMDHQLQQPLFIYHARHAGRRLRDDVVASRTTISRTASSLARKAWLHRSNARALLAP